MGNKLGLFRTRHHPWIHPDPQPSIPIFFLSQASHLEGSKGTRRQVSKSPKLRACTQVLHEPLDTELFVCRGARLGENCQVRGEFESRIRDPGPIGSRTRRQRSGRAWLEVLGTGVAKAAKGFGGLRAC